MTDDVQRNVNGVRIYLRALRLAARGYASSILAHPPSLLPSHTEKPVLHLQGCQNVIQNEGINF